MYRTVVSSGWVICYILLKKSLVSICCHWWGCLCVQLYYHRYVQYK